MRNEQKNTGKMELCGEMTGDCGERHLDYFRVLLFLRITIRTRWKSAAGHVPCTSDLWSHERVPRLKPPQCSHKPRLYPLPGTTASAKLTTIFLCKAIALLPLGCEPMSRLLDGLKDKYHLDHRRGRPRSGYRKRAPARRKYRVMLDWFRNVYNRACS